MHQPATIESQSIFEAPIFKRRWVAHLMFWLVYTLFFAILGEQRLEDIPRALVFELIQLPAKLVAVYTTLYWFIPRLLLKRNYWVFTLSLVAVVLACALLQRIIDYYIIQPQIDPFHKELFELLNYNRMFRFASSIVGIVLLAATIKIGRYYAKEQRMTQNMEKEKLEAELKFLKAQIHPHFLFNTLNNLYALTLKKSDKAPEVVLRLSGMVNYMLYDATTPRVSLDQEIESIHNYIALERIRYGTDLDIFFEISGTTNGVEIAPLLLLPFVENSFKHGISDSIQDKWIAINLRISEGQLTFQVENSRNTEQDRARLQAMPGGIGLTNVRRRLDLLYSERHELRIREEESAFLVLLKLDLRLGKA